LTSFNDLGLSAPILKALAAEGYETPTPIQAQTIPLALQGRDVIGLAQTGTGKTASFALPIIEKLAAERKHSAPKSCRSLVLAPTRELASQIAESFRVYGKFMGISVALVFGGVPIGRQFKALERGVDVLVATPGRLLDIIGQRGCNLGQVEILVLDEADHMLDMGFIHALNKIARMLPKQRQTLFFSATMPPPIAELAEQYLNNPERVAVAQVSSTAERVTQAVVHVEHAKKQDLLHALLQDKTITRALVFTRTKHGADRVVKRLADSGHPAEAIHGNKSQGQRERALAAFKNGQARLLVATEIAARGIDVDEVSHVINFDLPDVPEQYVHRIGRTARAGATGHAISFCAPDERMPLRDIERLTKVPVPVLEHKLGLPPPQPGERMIKPPGRTPKGSKPNPQRAPRARFGEQRGGGDAQREPRREGQQRDGQHRDGQHPRDRQPREHHARDGQSRDGQKREAPRLQERPQERASGGRDDGDRRDRKGNQVWSNGPAPRAGAPRTGAPRKPQGRRTVV
jgi:ATP-dependent RNA helicase RhlE